MKRIAVVGLGIIGGSIAGALTKAGYQIDAFNRSIDALNYALLKGYIQNKGKDLRDYDLVFLALPPQITREYLANAQFKEDALVCDICGVKTVMEETVYAQKRDYRYLGLHPMAGKETSGIESASPDLFQNANLIITISKWTNAEDVAEIKTLAKAMGFGKIVECSAKEHDKKIALTSQLAHIVSNAYVKSPQVENYEGFTGGSFQDMTRIAGVDESVWTPLYMANCDNVIEELNGLIENLCVYRDALLEKDSEKLKNALKEGRKIREKIKRNDE